MSACTHVFPVENKIPDASVFSVCCYLTLISGWSKLKSTTQNVVSHCHSIVWATSSLWPLVTMTTKLILIWYYKIINFFSPKDMKTDEIWDSHGDYHHVIVESTSCLVTPALEDRHSKFLPKSASTFKSTQYQNPRLLQQHTVKKVLILILPAALCTSAMHATESYCKM